MNQKQKSAGVTAHTLMTFWNRFSKATHETKDKPSPLLLRGGFCALLSFLLGACSLPFSVYPLGVAFLCAATDSLPFCILGFLIAGFARELPVWLYPVACILILLCRLLARIFIDVPARLGETVHIKALFAHLRGRIFAESLYLRMTSACVCVFFLSLVSIVKGGFRYYDLFGALFSIAIAPIAVLLYSGFFGADRTVGDKMGTFLHHAWAVALAVSVCLALTRISPLGIWLSAAASFVSVVAIGKRSGFAAAALSALACGACLGISYIPALLAVAVTAYCLLDASLSAAAGISCIVGSLTGYFLGSSSTERALFLPFLCGCVLFLTVDKLIKAYTLSLIPAKPKKEMPPPAEVPENDLSLERLSEAFFSLSESFFGLGRHLKKPSGIELRQLCDEAFDEICPLCPNRAVCWEEKYAVMQETIRRLAASLEKTGALTDADTPSELSLLCGLEKQVIQSIRARVAKLSGSRFSEERAQIFALDFAAMSRILREHQEIRRAADTPNTAAEKAVRERLCVLGFEPLSVSVLGERGKRVSLYLPLPVPDGKRMDYLLGQVEACLGICLSPLRATEREDGVLLEYREIPRLRWRQGSSFAAKEGVCGDALTTFCDKQNGYFYALLCDGMGSGVEAALTARLASTFLQKLLSAGARPETALRMLSDFLRLGRNGGSEESSTTVDLLQIDEYTGKGTFFKCGAAPTYVKRGGSIFKLSANTVPLGILKECNAKRIEFPLFEGDVVVMISDGIGGEEECLWLLDYLNSTEERDPQVIASFLTEAASAHGSRDDLSALILTSEQNR